MLRPVTGTSSTFAGMDVKDWIQIPSIDTDANTGDTYSAVAGFLNRLTSGLYEDTNYARAFWIIATLCLAVEPALVKYTPDEVIYDIQIFVFIVSTGFFVLQTVSLVFALKPWNATVKQSTKVPWLARWSRSKSFNSSDALRGIIFYFTHVIFKRGYVLFELIFIIIGWVAIIANKRGIACLRVFRVFRVLWYHEIKALRPLLFAKDTKIFKIAIEHDSTVIRAMKKIVTALNKLGSEMFTLTGRGGLLLILVFFYLAYTMGVMFTFDASDLQLGGKFTDSGLPDKLCFSVRECMYVMMRLSFFDTTGFDYMSDVYAQHKLMYYGGLIYMMVSSIGILFGLLAIFKAPFRAQAEDEDDVNPDTVVHWQLDRLKHILENRGEMIDALLVKAKALRDERQAAATSWRNVDESK